MFQQAEQTIFETSVADGKRWDRDPFAAGTYRSTDATVYCVVEGKGVAHVGGERFAFDAHDVFVVPSWVPVRLDADNDSVLFSYSDRPVIAALNLLREERA